jgi:hypothetical protein
MPDIFHLHGQQTDICDSFAVVAVFLADLKNDVLDLC